MNFLVYAEPAPHPVRLVVEDDYRRSRLTVFFRILLAIPHFVWVFLWTIAVIFAAIANWLVALIAGEPPAGLHRFLSRYIRYLTHLNAYLWLVANPYPGFVGDEEAYPVDVRLPGPTPQPRWKTLLRLLLAIPSFAIASTLGGAGNIRFYGGRGSGRYGGGVGGAGALALSTAILGWFAILVTGRMPKGLRDAGAYSVGYTAQMLAYTLLVTDRYPNADPTALLEDV